MLNIFNKKLISNLFSVNPQRFNNENLLNPIIKTLYNHFVYYPTPLNLNYNWSFGSLSLIFFIFQIISGLFLAMHVCRLHFYITIGI